MSDFLLASSGFVLAMVAIGLARLAFFRELEVTAGPAVNRIQRHTKFTRWESYELSRT